MLINQEWSLSAKEREVLKLMGQTWLKDGASAFGLKIDDQIVYQADGKLHGLDSSKPTKKQSQLEGLSPANTIYAPVTLHERQNGSIFLNGPIKRLNQTSLELDAHFLSANSGLRDDVDALSAELVEKQDQLLILYKLRQTMRRHLELQPLFASIIHVLQELFHIDALITLVSSGGLSPIVSAYPDNSWLNAHSIQALQKLHQRGESLILDTSDLKSIDNLLFLPLGFKEPFQASFVFVNKRGDRFKANDLKLAQFVGEQIEAQFEHVQLHQELLAKTRLQAEADMARKVQIQLLPTTPPEIQGLDLFAESKPASQVGGDFYLFMPDASLPLFILGDVSGKGMPAALLMTMLRSSFQHAAKVSHDHKTITADVLNNASHSMYDDFTTVEMFATAIVVAFDPTTRMLSYSNAGQSPVIYCPAKGDPRIVYANGPAMGITPVATAGLDSIILDPDDLFIICTDGFNEAWNSKQEMYGYDRLLSLISSLRGYSAIEIAIEIYMAVDEFSEGCEQDDDQTLIVIKGEKG